MPSAHPVGEPISKLISGSWPVDTPGGRYYAEIDDESPVTREGQLIFFAQFLRVGGRVERLVSNCPLSYEGNLVDVLGTATLSVLLSRPRFAKYAASKFPLDCRANTRPRTHPASTARKVRRPANRLPTAEADAVPSL